MKGKILREPPIKTQAETAGLTERQLQSLQVDLLTEISQKLSLLIAITEEAFETNYTQEDVN